MNKLVSLKNTLGKAKNKKGFTLVEMIIVMVIMAILAAALIPTMMGYINDARDNSNLATARAYYVAAQSVATKLSASDNAVTGTKIMATGTNWAELIAGLPGGTVSITMDSGASAVNGKVASIQFDPTGAGKTVTITAGGTATFSGTT